MRRQLLLALVHLITAMALASCFVNPLTITKFSSLYYDDVDNQSILYSVQDSHSIDRRSCVATLILGSNTFNTFCAEAATESSSEITLPLEPASGGTFCIRCTVFGMNNDSFRVYRTIVDTGSPYLVLPFAGNDQNQKRKQRLKMKVNDATLLSPSDYPSTTEIYGSVEGKIDWKLASYSFRDPRLQIRNYKCRELTTYGVVGVLDEALTNEATGGGTFQPYGLLGLIQNSNPAADRSRFPEPRPTFFEQECIEKDVDSKEYKRIKSFSLSATRRELTFSAESLIKDQSRAMKLVDLRQYGDFVDHYAVEVKSLSFDGITMSSKDITRPIVAVFDSGLTGCLLIRPFWDFVQKNIVSDSMQTTPDERDFQSASVQLKELRGTVCIISSSAEINPRQFYVNPIDLDWFDDPATAPYVIILGQTFLSQGSLTIDMDKRLSTFQSASSMNVIT